MSKYKFINLADRIFISITIFLLVYAWINFFTHNLILTFVLSLIFSASILYLLFYISNKKKIKTLNNKKLLKDMEDKFLAFRLLEKTEKIKMLNDYLKQAYETKFICGNLTYKKDGKTHVLIIATHIQKINNYDVVNLIEGMKKFDHIDIVCNECAEPIKTEIYANIKITILPKQEFYEKFLKNMNLDCSILSHQVKKISWKNILKNFIIPRKTKPYFVAGLIMFFSSLILPYRYYYIIFSTIFFVLSLACKIQPYFTISQSSQEQK